MTSTTGRFPHSQKALYSSLGHTGSSSGSKAEKPWGKSDFLRHMDPLRDALCSENNIDSYWNGSQISQGGCFIQNPTFKMQQPGILAHPVGFQDMPQEVIQNIIDKADEGSVLNLIKVNRYVNACITDAPFLRSRQRLVCKKIKECKDFKAVLEVLRADFVKKTLPYIQFLDFSTKKLSNYHLQELIPILKEQCPCLVAMDFKCNPEISDEGVLCIAKGMKERLRGIGLSKTHVSDYGIAVLGSWCPFISELLLAGTFMTDGILSQLGLLFPNLTGLDMAYTRGGTVADNEYPTDTRTFHPIYASYRRAMYYSESMTAEGLLSMGQKNFLPHLDQLNLTHTHTTKNVLEALAEAQAFPVLRKLNLEDTDVTEEDVKAILPMYPNLRKVRVHSIAKQDTVWSRNLMFVSMRRLKKLKDLKNNIPQIFPEQNLTHVKSLQQPSPCDDIEDALVAALKDRIHACKSGSDIACLLENDGMLPVLSKVRTLDLSRKNLQDSDLAVLCPLLEKHCPRLDTLNVSDNHIQVQGALILTLHLHHLQKLNLDGNAFSALGVLYLMLRLPTLRELSVCNMRIYDKNGLLNPIPMAFMDLVEIQELTLRQIPCDVRF